MAKRFLRTDHMRYSRLGKKRKSLQKWRKPKGRHNKLREKRFSYPKSPSVGYKNSRKESGKVEGKKVLLVKNLKELENAGKETAVIIAKVGAKKKIEIAKKAVEMKVHVLNLKAKTEKGKK